MTTRREGTTAEEEEEEEKRFTRRNPAEDDPQCGLFTAPEVRGSAKAGTVLRASKAAVVPVHLVGRNRFLQGQQKSNL